MKTYTSIVAKSFFGIKENKQFKTKELIEADEQRTEELLNKGYLKAVVKIEKK